MAKIKSVVDALDAVDEAQRGLYVKGDDGKFVLDLEGAPRGFVPRTQLDEFRTNNQRLTTELTASRENLTRFDGIDPIKAKELIDTQAQLDRADLLKKGDHETIIKQEVQRAVEPLMAQLTASQATVAEKDATIQKVTFEDAIIRAANAQGRVQSGAEEAIVSKAQAAGWSVVDGQPRQTVNGQVVYSNTKPGIVREVGEWIAEDALKAFPWAWEPSKGGGGGGNQDPAAGGPGTVRADDKDAFSANLDKIAKGEVKVIPIPR